MTTKITTRSKTGNTPTKTTQPVVAVSKKPVTKKTIPVSPKVTKSKSKTTTTTTTKKKNNKR